MSTDHSIRAQAVSLWEELTGMAVNSTSYSFKVGGESFDLYNANKRVKQAQAVGDDLTVALVIKTLAEQFASAEKFTLADILTGNDKLKSRLELVGRMGALFNDVASRTLFESFYGHCERALAHYRELPLQDLSEETRQFVRISGCFVGLDAFHGIERLTRLMICDGPVLEGAKAKISRLVFAFESIEDLITHARQIPTGFSLCVIMAPHISDSFFVMVVNTGGRVVVLTDKGDYSHPLQESRMRGRNDRYNLNRIDGSHFPYELLGIEWGDSGRRSTSAKGGSSLTVSDSGLRVLGQLSDLKDWDLLWLHLFIDQCRDRYFERKLTEPQLATGSMVRLPHKWSEGSENLPVPVAYELKLDTRSSSDLNSQFLHTIEPKWAGKYNANLWMEERFAGDVPDDCLYLPANALNGDTPMLTIAEDGKRELTRRDTTALRSWESNNLPILALQGMTNTALSTAERVIRDCHFLARYNQSQVIGRLVKEDYEFRKEAVQEWFYKAAAKHLPNLINDLLALDHERFWVDKPPHQDALRMLGKGELVQAIAGGVRVLYGFRSIMIRYEPVRKQSVPFRNKASPSMANTLRLINYTYGHYQCAVNRRDEAQLFISLDLSSVLDLMTVTGLPLERIPAELRHRGIDTYRGNSILDRIDPLGDLRNPWDSLPLRYSVPVSLKAFKELRRSRGLPIPKAPDLEAFAIQQAEAARRRVTDQASLSIAGME